MKTAIALTTHQINFIHGCLEACGCDTDGTETGEILIGLLESAESVVIVYNDGVDDGN
jgi:hypothetical protein